MALPPGTTALNLGCGTSVAPGWINIDSSPNARLSKYPRLRRLAWRLGLLSDFHYSIDWPRDIVIHDLRKRLPFAAGSADYVYSSHLLEHFTPRDARRLLGEVHRVLRPGGVVRLVVPDLAIGARRYLDALAADPSDATAAPTFLEWLWLCGSGGRDRHRWMYDAPSLSALLEESGFTRVVVCQPGQGRVPDADLLDNRPEDSVHVEAERP